MKMHYYNISSKQSTKNKSFSFTKTMQKHMYVKYTKQNTPTPYPHPQKEEVKNVRSKNQKQCKQNRNINQAIHKRRQPPQRNKWGKCEYDCYPLTVSGANSYTSKYLNYLHELVGQWWINLETRQSYMSMFVCSDWRRKTTYRTDWRRSYIYIW